MADEPIQTSQPGSPVSVIQSGSDSVTMPGAMSVSADLDAKPAATEEAPKPATEEAPKVEGDKAPEGDKPKEEAPKAASEDKPKTVAEAKPEEVQAVKDRLKAAGGFYADPRYESAGLEFEITGDVTPETISATATAFNVPEDMVKEFINGAKAGKLLQASQAEQSAKDTQAATDKVVSEIHALVPDGAKGWEAFSAWSKENIPASDRAAYDAVLDSNPTAAKLLMQGFVDKFKAAGNGAPRDLTQEGSGAPASSAGSKGYASQAEMERDMNDPRYRSGDTAFHAQVRERLAHSKW